MKNKTKEEKMTTREVLSVCAGGYKLLFSLCPGASVFGLFMRIWNALTPYVGIYLSARIIGELAGARDPAVLRSLVLWLLVSQTVFGIAGSFLGKANAALDSVFWEKHSFLITKKMLELDYVDVDDPTTHATIQMIHDIANGAGYGLAAIRSVIPNIIGAFASFSGGVALTVSLFSSRVPDGTGMAPFFNSPVAIVTVVLLLVASSFGKSALNFRSDKVDINKVKDRALINRLFSWFGFIGHDANLAADLRMFRIDRKAMRIVTRKDDIFGSRGFFANLYRGRLGVYGILSVAFSHMFSIILYIFVSVKALAGAFGVGAITQYVAAVGRISESVSSIIGEWGNLVINAPHIKMLFEFLNMPNRMYQGSLSTEKRLDGKYDVEFRNVSFRYPGTETDALSHVNIKFSVGKRLAVVGRNGSGKTTFIKLLCRLYDPTEGEILLNGINIKKYDYKQYLDIFAIVFQDYVLFPFRIGSNVAAREEFDRDRTLRSLCDAGFGDRLEELDDGLDTYIYKERKETGIVISGGEAQKIAIARALYKDSPFLILDEPTAALDPIAEAEIYSSLDRIVRDRTAIFISHRLSSCRFCDTIAVFKDGTISETGSHEELLKKGGEYGKLWGAQAQYYN